MSKSNTLPFACDVCNTAKEENHGRWRVMFNISIMDIPGYAIYEWNDGLATMAYANHACGDRCTHTLLERAMALSAARKSVGGAA